MYHSWNILFVALYSKSKFYLQPNILQSQLSQITHLQDRSIMPFITFLSDRKLWTHEEDQLIIQLVRKHGIGSWIPIASEMKSRLIHHTRTSKQIRERWHNHLSPQINKSQWTQEQQNIIFEIHNKIGSKWKQIAKYLNNRTDNAVKNHFYSTLRRSLRRINKFYGFKNSTNQMKNLKPSTLTFLIEKSHESSQTKDLIRKIFQYAKQKPKKSIFQSSLQQFQLFQQQKRKFEELLTQLDNFNQEFSTKKKCKINHSIYNSLQQIPSQQLQEQQPNISIHKQKITKSRKIKQQKRQCPIKVQNIDFKKGQCSQQQQPQLQFEELLAQQKQINTIDSTYLQNDQQNILLGEQKQQQEFYFGNHDRTESHWFDKEQRMSYLPLSMNMNVGIHNGQINHLHFSNQACLAIQSDFNQI